MDDDIVTRARIAVDPERFRRAEQALFALVAERLREARLCHCGAFATHVEATAIGQRDMCDGHSAAANAQERHDAKTIRLLTDFVGGYDPTG